MILKNYVAKFNEFRIEANDRVTAILDKIEKEETEMEKAGGFDCDNIDDVFDFKDTFTSELEKYGNTSKSGLEDGERFLAYQDDENDSDYIDAVSSTARKSLLSRAIKQNEKIFMKYK
jgi:hypothetical protein